MARYESTRVYEEKEVDVFADEFETWDTGYGKVYGPTDVWAKYNGVEFPLTEEQVLEISTAAIEYLDGLDMACYPD